MRYVIIRDDDTNAVMPISYLERLYRPFLDRGLPVNLATIPNVSTEAAYPDGRLEYFLVAKGETKEKLIPIGANQALVRHLKENPGYKVVQHGCRHDSVHNRAEFDHHDRAEIVKRLEEGKKHLLEAGFGNAETFVAPYDQLSKESLEEIATRYKVLSTGWFEMRRLPWSWLPNYAVKKSLNRYHWEAGGVRLMAHPGCHLSYHKDYGTMLDTIISSIQSRRLTVLVSHWWEYFRDNIPDEKFIAVLHETAEYLASQKDIQVVTFEDIAQGKIALN